MSDKDTAAVKPDTLQTEKYLELESPRPTTPTTPTTLVTKTDEIEFKVVENEKPHEIIVWLFVNAFDDIIMSDETFYADFDLILLWEVRNDNKYNTFTADNLDVEDSSLKFFKENMQISNGFDITVEFIKQGFMPNGGIDWYGTELEPRKHPKADEGKDYLPTIWLKYQVKGRFKERFELYNFPMDVQDLTIHMAASKHKSKLIINPVLDPDIYFFPWPSAIDQSINIDEYTVEAFHIIRYYSAYEYANIKCQVKIARKFAVYFWKVGIYMLLLCTGGLGVFCMNGSNLDDGGVSIGDQLSLLFTLLLTGVAVQFVVTTWLPNLSYVTLLDQYIISSFLVIFAIILLLFIIDIMDLDLEDNDNEDLKWYSIIIIAAFFVIIQTIWTFIFYKRRLIEWKKVQKPTAGLGDDDDGIKNNNDELIPDEKANAVITVTN